MAIIVFLATVAILEQPSRRLFENSDILPAQTQRQRTDNNSAAASGRHSSVIVTAVLTKKYLWLAHGNHSGYLFLTYSIAQPSILTMASIDY